MGAPRKYVTWLNRLEYCIIIAQTAIIRDNELQQIDPVVNNF